MAAQTVVESVGSAEESDGSLADWVQKVPQKFAEYLAETSRNCIPQALRLVKSYWPLKRPGFSNEEPESLYRCDSPWINSYHIKTHFRQ